MKISAILYSSTKTTLYRPRCFSVAVCSSGFCNVSFHPISQTSTKFGQRLLVVKKWLSVLLSVLWPLRKYILTLKPDVPNARLWSGESLRGGLCFVCGLYKKQLKSFSLFELLIKISLHQNNI